MSRLEVRNIGMDGLLDIVYSMCCKAEIKI